jgi:hypothetical protein
MSTEIPVIVARRWIAGQPDPLANIAKDIADGKFNEPDAPRPHTDPNTGQVLLPTAEEWRAYRDRFSK